MYSLSSNFNINDPYHYKNIERNGQDGRLNTCNNFTCNWTVYNVDPSTVGAFDGTNWSFFESTIVPNSALSGDQLANAWSDDQELRLIEKLIDKIAPAKANLSVSLAEVDKTGEMILDLGKAGLDLWKDIKHLHISRAFDRLKRFSKKIRSENARRRTFQRDLRLNAIKDPMSIIDRHSSLRVSLLNKQLKDVDWRNMDDKIIELYGLNRERLTRDARKLKSLRNHKEREQAFKALDVVSQRFLLMQYGLKPLISDVQDLARSLGDFVEHSTPSKYVAQANSMLSGSNGQNHTTYKIRKRYTAYADVIRPRPINLYAPDPLQIAWERIPYSFVVDWFLGIGQYLAALDGVESHIRGQVCEAFRAVRLDKLITHKPSNDLIVIPTTADVLIGSFTRRKVTISVPTPAIKALQDAFSFTHVANGLALIASGGKNVVRYF